MAKAANKPAAIATAAANAAATARKPRASKAALLSSNVPAIVPGAPTASNLPAATAPLAGAASNATPAGGWPAANNGLAWLALIVANVPAINDAKGHKYGEGKGMLPAANDMFVLTPFGTTDANAGGKARTGRYTVHALMCLAHKLAQAATGESAVCGAAVAYFAYTVDVLALLQSPHTKTKHYIGAPRNGCYSVPCPNWLSGYIRGNVRHILFGVPK